MKAPGKYQGRYLWRYLSAGAILLLIILAAVLLSAGSWLESDSGRNLLQRELSKALGLEADFRGEYSLRLFPVIRIAGRDLALKDAATGLTVVSVDYYELHLALRPLLRKEINILKVSIQEAILDLDRLAEFNSAKAGEAESDFQLPGIRDLEITGLQLQRSAVDFLLVSQLKLTDFAENQKSRIAIELAMDQATAASQSAQLEGVLQITANPLELNLLVEQLSLQIDDQSWSVGQGELNWSADLQKLWGELRGSLSAYSGRYFFSVLSADALQIDFSVDLQSANNESFAVNLKARDTSDNWLLEKVDLNLNGQVLGGTGCFSTNDQPVLQLELEAEKLDLDALQKLLPAELFPKNPAAESESFATEVSEDSEWPLKLAIALSARQLNWSGTSALGVRVLIGAEPDCTSGAETVLN